MDVVVSYETLFELLRLERSKTELQKLPNTFLVDSKEMMDQDKQELISLEGSDRKKKELHIKSTAKILNELYERRERKIVNMALDKSKAKTAIIDFPRFLDHELKMFEEILQILNQQRERIHKVEKKEPIAEPKIKLLRTVRFLNAMPSFMGPELEEYGPFDEEEIARLPSRIVEVLVKKKRAEEITSQYS